MITKPKFHNEVYNKTIKTSIGSEPKWLYKWDGLNSEFAHDKTFGTNHH